MQTRFLKYFKVLITLLGAIVIVVNLVFGFFGVMAQLERQKTESIEPGFQYADFKESLEGIPIAGFLTGGNETAEGNDGQFMLAQYMLAPTVLDLNNSAHRYNILDCATPQEALGMLKIINAKPVYMNAFGKILAEKNL